MTNLFNTASNDQSIYYLYYIFGYMDQVFPSNFAQMTTIMTSMFQTINTVALVLGSLMVVYTTIFGIVKTAHEGEFLGKNWHSLWVPLRTVMGVASLFPTTAGYSLLQIMMMWFILQGVGAADSLWSTVLVYVQANHSPYSKPPAAASSPSTSGNTSSTSVLTQMNALFAGLTCQATLARNDPDTYTPSSTAQNLYYCYKNSSSFCTQNSSSMFNITANPSKNGIYTYSMGPNGICGNITFPDPKTYPSPTSTATPKPAACSLADIPSVIYCAAITAEASVLQSVVSSMGASAATLADLDHQYIQFYEGVTPPATPAVTFPTPAWITNYCQANGIASSACCLKGNGTNASPPCHTSGDNTFPPPYSNTGGATNWLDNNTTTSANVLYPFGMLPILGADLVNVPQVMANNYSNAISVAVQAATPQSALTGWYAAANNNGWLLAGAYYYQIASMTNASTTSLSPPLGVSVSDTATSNSATSSFRNNYQTATDVLTAVTKAAGSASIVSSNAPPGFDSGSGLISGAVSDVFGWFQGMLTGNSGIANNPLIAAQNFGEKILGTATTMYVTFIAVSAIAMIAGSIDFMGLGTGDPVAPLASMAGFVIYTAYFLIMLFCGWAFTFGGMLAVYLPLVPYILYTFATIGWFSAVLEAMVASPFVALGILSPNGQHEILGRAEPGVMILLNTFLRPTLIVFGMMGGMLLAPVVVTMINSGFSLVTNSITSGLGVVEGFVFISTYATFVISAMNKCFALIYLVPERILTWVGGQAISYGEGEGLGQVKAGAEQAAGEASGAAKQFRSGASFSRKAKPDGEGDGQASGKGDKGGGGGKGGKGGKGGGGSSSVVIGENAPEAPPM